MLKTREIEKIVQAVFSKHLNKISAYDLEFTEDTNGTIKCLFLFIYYTVKLEQIHIS